jgi:hypothetical protein
MKKTFIIALCCLAVAFVACKPEPTPEPVDYSENYVGNYIGTFDLTIATIDNQAVTNMTFPVPNIGITATVTVDNETRQTKGTATADKADFEAVDLYIDKPDQGYTVELKLKMEGTKDSDNTLIITGNFTDGHGVIVWGQANQFSEASGTIRGELVKQ